MRTDTQRDATLRTEPAGGERGRSEPHGAERPSAEPAGGERGRSEPHGAERPGAEPAGGERDRSEPHDAERPSAEPAGGKRGRSEPHGAERPGAEPAGGERGREWALLGEWLVGSPLLLRGADLSVLRERLVFVGRARASLAALEAALVAEVARRDGNAAAAELLRRDQKRSRSGARKAVKAAAQLQSEPKVAKKLADGAITPEAAKQILDAAAEAPIDQGALLDAAEAEPDDLFRRTVKDHINERTSEEALTERRARQYAKRRASISEQPDGMFHLFADLDPLAGAHVRTAMFAKADELFRRENPRQRSTPPQRLADALHQLLTAHSGHGTSSNGGAGHGISTGTGHSDSSDGGTGHSDSSRGGAGMATGVGSAPSVELLVLADYDAVHDQLVNARLSDGTRLTEAETLAAACDAKILPGIFNKHTGNVVLGRSQRKVSPRLRKRLVARDRGCIGCGAHEQICEVHHIDHWAHGGATSYDNTCLICWRCHHIRIHLHGEQVTRHPDGTLTLTPPKRPSDPAGKHPPGTRPPTPADAPRAADLAQPGKHPPGKHPPGRATDRPRSHPGERSPGKHPPDRAADRPRSQPGTHPPGTRPPD